VPVNTIIFTVVYTLVLSLVNIGSTVAFNAILSLATSALMATYAMSISCITYRRLSVAPLPPARWSLGRAGLPINILGLIYACWSFFWSFWPSVYHPTAAEFNWASVIFAGFMALSGAFYFLGKRKTYKGPVAFIRRVDTEES
jgi:choline transport protein